MQLIPAHSLLGHDQTTLIRDFASRCRERIEEFEKTQVRCGLIGPSGSGKSSLINAIAGERIARVGVVETTTDPLEISHRGITFVDLPGCGTRRWPKDTYVERLNLAAYDCFLLVTAQRFYENDAFLFHQLRSLGKPCFVVRNMIDRAIEDGRHDHGHDEDEIRRIIEHDITVQLEPDPPERVYLTSARQPAQHDLQALLADIGTALAGLKQSRFVADMAAYGQEALQRKRKVAQERIPPMPAWRPRTAASIRCPVWIWPPMCRCCSSSARRSPRSMASPAASSISSSACSGRRPCPRCSPNSPSSAPNTWPARV